MNPAGQPRRRLAVAVDLGGTQVRVALVDADGTLLARAAMPTDIAGGPRAVVRQIRQLVSDTTAGIDRSLLGGIGVCAPGPLDSEAGVVLGIPTMPGWVDIPLVPWLQEALNLPVRLENDGLAAALGEWRHGAGQGLNDFIYITVSTGIGGGAVVGGRLLRGRAGLAAHFGHMTILEDGEVCPCGNRGCWEAQASGTALGVAARRLAAATPQSRLFGLGALLEASHVMDAARAGDALASRLVSREGDLLGIGIVNLLHLFSPEAVVIGGGVSSGFELLRPAIAHRIQSSALPPFRGVPVVAARLGQNSGLIGAACLVLPEG